MPATLQEIAAEAVGYFETADRPQLDEHGDPVQFVRVKDDAPEWVTDLVREAHGRDVADPAGPAMLPDDWRYKTTRAALDWIAELSEYADPDDERFGFAESAVDDHTADRCEWLASHTARAGYCDGAFEEYGYEFRGIVDLIGVGQYAEAAEVYELVVEFLQERRGEAEAAVMFGDADDEEVS